MSADDLIAAFAAEFGITPSDDNRFGASAHQLTGVCDGASGVQWNTWMSFRENSAYLGVNLEGMKYDGWPIARYIEREFNHPRLFEVRALLAAPDTIELILHRDAWQVSARPPIDERHIGLNGRTLPEIDLDGCKATLQEAYTCLRIVNGRVRRARQVVTTKSGPRELPVSPHLQFRQRISEAVDGHRDWSSSLRGAREALAPMYEYVKEQSAP
jgi:hypothetical protein